MRIRSKLVASFRWLSATMVLLFATNILPAVGALQGRAYADTPGSSSITWGQQGRDKADPGCLEGQTATFHFVLSPKGTHITSAGSISVTFSPSGSDAATGTINGNGAGSYYVSGSYDSTASTAVVTGATWTTTSKHPDATPQLELSSSSCTGTPTQTVTAGAITYKDECGTANDTYTVPSTANVIYKDSMGNVVSAGSHAATGTVLITAYAASGYTLSSPYSFSHIFTDTSCGPTEVRAAHVTFTDICGTNSDGYTIPNSPHVYYTLTGSSTVLSVGFHAASGSVSVTAHADEGYMLTGQTVFTGDFTDVPCNSEMVTLCHATHSIKNPYVEITVSAAGAYNGHLGNSHQGGRDIIPPFYFNGHQYSQNWDANGQAIFEAGCKTPQPPKTHKVHATAPLMVQITCDEDGSYTIPATEGVQYYVEGVPTDAGTFTVDTNMTVHITAQAKTGYKLVGRHAWTFKFHVPENCGGTNTGVTPAAPTFAPATCDHTSTGSYTIPTTTGVTYQVNLNGGGFTDATAGTHSVATGTMVTVRAMADSGYTLTGTNEWSATIAGASGCVLGGTDVCQNLTGSQATVPSGYHQDSMGDCVLSSTPGKGGGGEVLGTSTVAATSMAPQLVNTGENALVNVIIGATLIGLTLAVGFGARKQLDQMS